MYLYGISKGILPRSSRRTIINEMARKEISQWPKEISQWPTA